MERIKDELRELRVTCEKYLDEVRATRRARERAPRPNSTPTGTIGRMGTIYPRDDFMRAVHERLVRLEEAVEKHGSQIRPPEGMMNMGVIHRKNVSIEIGPRAMINNPDQMSGYPVCHGTFGFDIAFHMREVVDDERVRTLAAEFEAFCRSFMARIEKENNGSA